LRARKAPAPDTTWSASKTVCVNRLSDVLLQNAEELSVLSAASHLLVPYLNAAAADRIITLRPFSDAADLQKRVNAEAANNRRRVSNKMVKYFDFRPADAQP